MHMAVIQIIASPAVKVDGLEWPQRATKLSKIGDSGYSRIIGKFAQSAIPSELSCMQTVLLPIKLQVTSYLSNNIQRSAFQTNNNSNHRSSFVEFM